MNKPKKIYPTTVEEVNNISGGKYCIMEPVTIHIPGDERSRTNPGHGYGPTTNHSWRIAVFSSQYDWEQEIKAKTLNKESFIPFEMKVPEVTSTVVVEVNCSD